MHQLVKLPDGLGVGQEHQVEYGRELFSDVRVSGDEDTVCGIGFLDQIMRAQANIPLGVIADDPKVLPKPDDHVVHHEARGLA